MTKRGLVLLGVCIVMGVAWPAQAQLIVTPFVSANVRTEPGFIDLEDAARDWHGGFGVTVSMLTGGWIFVEAETSFTPSAFGGDGLVESSRLLTLTGSVVVAPTRWKRIRPYASLGAGLADMKSVDIARLFVVDSTRAAGTAGAGVWVWIGQRVGLRTSIRFLRSLHDAESGTLETWQPSVGLSVKF